MGFWFAWVTEVTNNGVDECQPSQEKDAHGRTSAMHYGVDTYQNDEPIRLEVSEGEDRYTTIYYYTRIRMMDLEGIQRSNDKFHCVNDAV